jgi:hypothetical protein
MNAKQLGQKTDELETGQPDFFGSSVAMENILPLAVNHALSSIARQVDVFLRRQQDIFEFCDDPRCLLRIALRPVKADFVLPNGFQVKRGRLIGELHLWNEHIPPIPSGGPDFAWGKLIRLQTFRSFALLAENVCLDSRFRGVQIFCARTRLGADKSPELFDRLMQSFGFELVEKLACANWREQLVALGECLHLWSLLRAFNPVALTNHRLIQLPFRRLWMSRETLLRKYPAILRSPDTLLAKNDCLVQEPGSFASECVIT